MSQWEKDWPNGLANEETDGKLKFGTDVPITDLISTIH